MDKTVTGDRRPLARKMAFFLLCLVCVIFCVSVSMGPVSIPVKTILRLLGEGWLLPHVSGHEMERILVGTIRLPRTITGFLVGGALAVSGVMMQSLFRNPLADPGLVGVSSGAALGAVMAIVLGGSVLLPWSELLSLALVPTFAFGGGLLSTLMLYGVATKAGQTSTATMLLAGIGIGALTSAVTSFIIYIADDSQLRDVTYWFMGGLGGATWRQLTISGPLIVMLFALCPWVARGLDALMLGETTARHLGVEVQRLKRLVIACVALAVAAAVSLAGVVGFIGIIVPHLLRMAIGPEHKFLLPSSALFGGSLVVLADIFCRMVVQPAELPLGIVTAAIGAPVFLMILLRGRSIMGV